MKRFRTGNHNANELHRRIHLCRFDDAIVNDLHPSPIYVAGQPEDRHSPPA